MQVARFKGKLTQEEMEVKYLTTHEAANGCTNNTHLTQNTSEQTSSFMSAFIVTKSQIQHTEQQQSFILLLQ